MLLNIPTSGPMNEEPVDPKKMTAVQLVTGFNGFGVHTLLSIVRSFPNLYKNIIFVSIAVCDSGSFKGPQAVCDLTDSTREALEKYVDLARRLGIPADYRFDIGTDVVESATDLCGKLPKNFQDRPIFTGQLIFATGPCLPQIASQRNRLCHPAASSVEWHDHGHSAHPCKGMKSDSILRGYPMSMKPGIKLIPF